MKHTNSCNQPPLMTSLPLPHQLPDIMEINVLASISLAPNAALGLNRGAPDIISLFHIHFPIFPLPVRAVADTGEPGIWFVCVFVRLCMSVCMWRREGVISQDVSEVISFFL